jgi:hypothetical protein
MVIAIFDAYKAVSLLQKRGLSKEAAEGIIELLRDVTENNLVTKGISTAPFRRSTSRWVIRQRASSNGSPASWSATPPEPPRSWLRSSSCFDDCGLRSNW